MKKQQMKELYISPDMEIIVLPAVSIVITSNPDDPFDGPEQGFN